MNKYADTVKYGNFDWKVKYQSLGRKVPKKQRKRALVREIHFDTLLRLLQKTDWAKTPIYEMFIEEQRWRHTDESIYSEIELKYLHSSLQKMQNLPSQEEFNITEGQAILEKHWDKTLHTLEVLMTHTNMMYFFEKVKLEFDKLQKHGIMPTLVHLEKVMNRCFKMYQLIDTFMKIFKLIHMKEVSQANC